MQTYRTKPAAIRLRREGLRLWFTALDMCKVSFDLVRLTRSLVCEGLWVKVSPKEPAYVNPSFSCYSWLFRLWDGSGPTCRRCPTRLRISAVLGRRSSRGHHLALEAAAQHSLPQCRRGILRVLSNLRLSSTSASRAVCQPVHQESDLRLPYG